ncbi:MAG TPA: sigma-70 family RNA polymerase sigma factor [Candidatus Dormibacteraeota bacterium]|nr:sigma-70 family RNA polymerase sigma factor [Candidatus Dormibacteraeota bacterium]
MNKEDTLAVADRPWFEAHVRLLARPAYQFSLMVTQNPAIAEEILQDALTQLWATPTTPAEESEFRRYLYRVIASRATDYHRRQAIARRIRFWQAAPEDPMAEINRRAGDQEMGRLLSGLSARERQVAYLYYFEDQSADEVARHLGIKPATVRVLLHRLLDKLRKLGPTLNLQEQSS